VSDRTPISAAGIAIGLGLVAVAAIIASDAARMQVPPSYARVGPQLFPYGIAFGLAIIGAYMAWSSWARHAPREIVSEEGATDWWSLLFIFVGLLLHLLLLKPVGFVLVSAGLFLLVSIAFGSRAYLRDAIVGIVLAFLTYVGFNHVLGLSLPPGVLAGII
jgi:putative tricarboxylic transport membrane protein